MICTETHKNFTDGSKGRLTIKSDAGEVLAVIMTPVQKARKFCEAHPETPQGKTFAETMAAAGRAEQATQLTEQLADLENEEVAPVPAVPVLVGANLANTALVSAQRKLVKLHEAAMTAEPVSAVLAITTSRGNKYLKTCDDYRTLLLKHFGADTHEA